MHLFQEGRWSLKKVLSAFDPDLEYGDLHIQEGMEAVVQHSRIISPETPETEAGEIWQNLFEYCEQNTGAIASPIGNCLGYFCLAPVGRAIGFLCH